MDPGNEVAERPESGLLGDAIIPEEYDPPDRERGLTKLRPLEAMLLREIDRGARLPAEMVDRY